MVFKCNLLKFCDNLKRNIWRFIEILFLIPYFITTITLYIQRILLLNIITTLTNDDYLKSYEFIVDIMNDDILITLVNKFFVPKLIALQYFDFIAIRF